MNFAEANEIDLINYLFRLGYKPEKVSNANYWYLSPLRNEKTASFKIDKNKNAWYDHGIGKGGKLIDFIMEYHSCNAGEALNKISGSVDHPIRKDNGVHETVGKNAVNEIDKNAAIESKVVINEAKQPITNLLLCSYLKKRQIEPGIARKFCYEVLFTLNQKEYTSVGFKNSAGGFELRNEYFKGSSSPKDVSYLDNKAKSISVFEGFFDFLSFQGINKNQEHELSNFLVLNSLSFFERSLLLMEKHSRVDLYLDNDDAGKKYTSMALKRSPQFVDHSNLYKGYKDLNDWVVHIGKSKQQGRGFRFHS